MWSVKTAPVLVAPGVGTSKKTLVLLPSTEQPKETS